MHFISVSVSICIKHESTNWMHYFYVSYWRHNRHFTWSSEPGEGLATCSAKGVPSFFSYFNTMSIGQARGIKPATTNSAVRCSSDWTNPAIVKAAWWLELLQLYYSKQIKKPVNIHAWDINWFIGISVGSFLSSCRFRFFLCCCDTIEEGFLKGLPANFNVQYFW